MNPKKLTNLDLVNDCDSFPYCDEDSSSNKDLIDQRYYKLCFDLRGSSSRTFGYIPINVVTAMPWDGQWTIDHERKTVKPNKQIQDHTGITDIFDATLRRARSDGIFEVLRGWRNEKYAITGTHEPSQINPLISVERSGSPLFGINTYGVHMTMYTIGSAGIFIWTPRRAASKQTYPGMLDNTVAGGLSAGEEPFECLVREAAEEASLPESLVRSKARACGTVSYFHIRDQRAGGETGLLQPECQYVYDLEVASDVRPRPNDDEVEGFELLSVDEVKTLLGDGQFKPNCALVLLDFFVRHGILTPENEPHYAEIVARLHRKLPFPTSPIS